MIARLRTITILAAAVLFMPAVSYAVADPCASTSGTHLCDNTFLGIPTYSFIHVVRLIVNTLGFIAGVLAVVFIIIGGINLATSEGDPNKVAGARRTISFSIVGLVIAILAPAIVNFIISKGPQ